MKYPVYTQLDAMDCGPTCLKMIAKYYGKSYQLQTLRNLSFMNRLGSNLLGLSEAAESIGLRSTGVKVSVSQMYEEVPLPCILHWDQKHFVVCYNIRKSKRKDYKVLVADPAGGLLTYNSEEFEKHWVSTAANGEGQGIALLLQPKPEFYDQEDEKNECRKGVKPFLRYLKPYKSQLFQLVVGMIAISIIQLIFPFLTQSLVDIGIRNSDIGFIKLILISQLLLFIAKLSAEFIRSWLLLHINTRINISLISDFLIKIMKLPLRFFNTKTIGDILQRINDHHRIEAFLTGNSVALMFSFINFFVFAIVIGFYKWQILLLFLLGNGLYITYVLLFMKYRRKLDYKKFSLASDEQSTLIQMITGMQDIKLGNCERQKRWQWEQIQTRLFRVNVKSLAVGQVQQVGSVFFSQLTNILITFMAAQSVVNGSMSLGMMMALSYIIGQLSTPIDQFIGFAQNFQDAKISLERLNEIHGTEDEDQSVIAKLDELPSDLSISLKEVSFSYEGADRDYVLNDINLEIPQHKVTAIVGASGSGKTTLVKLLLGFYQPQKGIISIGNSNLDQINPHFWRSKTGSVLQDGYLFSDTIAGNIAFGDQQIDTSKLIKAADVANIKDFIETLPMSYNTKIGMDGQGLSQGQKQRILIARAIYKNPEYIFFDEATNALDANNEKVIMENLSRFLIGKTAVVVAHRLSTVKNADNIIVMDKGRIVESGNHSELTIKKGFYYNLVKNQLELGGE